MDLSEWIEALFPKEFLQKIYRLLPNPSFERRMRWDLFKRPDYAYGVYRAALTAQALDIKKISAIEFGVAAGNGLLGLEEAASEVSRHTGVVVDTYGFDTGIGMPPPVDYRDNPYLWQAGFFQMDKEALVRRLSQSKLILGEFTETVPGFAKQYNPAPIGFISFDADYYSSTVTAFKLLAEDHAYFLPRVLCYFDDMIGGDWELHSHYTGELLAIDEFNQQNPNMKIAKINGMAQKRVVPNWWHDLMYAHHRFDHPLYSKHVFPDKNWQLKLGTEVTQD
jgi:hypothetical protein